MVLPKILVGIVTYEGKDYIFDRCYQAVKNFDYPNYEIVVVDNTKGTSYQKKLRMKGVKKVHTVKRRENPYFSIAAAQNKVREIFLEGDYTHLLMVESDLIPPKNTIQRLLGYSKDVVGSLYYLGTVVKTPCITIEKPGSNKAYPRLKLVGSDDETGKLLGKPEEIQDYVNKGLMRVHGCGFGCTLMRRDVVKLFTFKAVMTNNEDKPLQPSDTWVYLRLHAKDIPVYVDTDFEVPHYPQDWDKVKDRFGGLKNE